VATKQEDAKSFFLDNLHGRIFLGLTGTPHYDNADDGIVFKIANNDSSEHGYVFEY
jgi:hypothetical protein